jgi:hypothetical protein
VIDYLDAFYETAGNPDRADKALARECI